MDKYKTCFTCKQTKPVTEFGIHKDRKDGYDSYCLICRRIQRNKYRNNNLEATRKSQKEIYKKNKQSYIDRAAKWQKNNRDKVAIRNRKWRETNKELMAFYQRSRRAKILANTIYAVTAKDLQRLYSQPCIYCGANSQIEIDHVIPIARGGTHGIGNLISACQTCNRSKQDKFVMEWRIWQKKTP